MEELNNMEEEQVKQTMQLHPQFIGSLNDGNAICNVVSDV
jgi:hypothetical protein